MPGVVVECRCGGNFGTRGEQHSVIGYESNDSPVSVLQTKLTLRPGNASAPPWKPDNCSHCKAHSEDVLNEVQVYYSSFTHFLFEMPPSSTLCCAVFSLIEQLDKLAAWRTSWQLDYRYARLHRDNHKRERHDSFGNNITTMWGRWRCV